MLQPSQEPFQLLQLPLASLLRSCKPSTARTRSTLGLVLRLLLPSFAVPPDVSVTAVPEFCCMGTPVYRQQGVMLMRNVAPHVPTCHARMFECAAAQASGGNLTLYALYLEEFITAAEADPDLPATTVLQRALQPLQRVQALQPQQRVQALQPQQRVQALQPQKPGSQPASQPGSQCGSLGLTQNVPVDESKAVDTSVWKHQQHTPDQAHTQNRDQTPNRTPALTAGPAKKSRKLVCPMCRSANESVIPFEKQRRSADEPAHQYAQCLNDDCRHVWLVSS